jgi:trimeric autotransporter adhesin
MIFWVTLFPLKNNSIMKKGILTFICLITLFVTGYSQYIINTFAGTGVAGYSGDGGPATSAQLDGPGGVDLDASGNVYIADKYNERIRKVVAGTINTIAGNGTQSFSGDGGLAVNATMNYPTSVAIGKTIANVYITDYSNQRVRLVTPGGIISTFAGNGSQGFSGDGGLATNCEMYNPYEIATDNAGNVYICDRYNHRVRKVDGSGIITTIAGTGTGGFSGDGGAATSADLYYPSSVHVDAFGNIFIADQFNHRIRKITGGIISTVVGDGTPGSAGDGGPATSAQLNNPHGIFVDNSGNLYIADSDNNKVRKVSAGIITTIAGTGTPGYTGDGGIGTSAQLTYPTKVAVNNSGQVYVADYNNNVIRILTPMVGIEENGQASTFLLYPNPSTGLINITTSKLSGSESTLITVTNLLGKTVYTKLANNSATSILTIDITEQPAGIYFVNINGSSQRIIKS